MLAEVDRTDTLPEVPGPSKKRKLDQTLEEKKKKMKYGANSVQQTEFNKFIVDFLACTGSSFNIV